MLSLGCVYLGDDQLFLCQDNDGDTLFTITSTQNARGLIGLELLTSSTPSIKDLVFSMRVPIWTDPLAIFDVMARGLRYCQRRLGGVLVNEVGEAITEAVGKEQIKAIVAQLGKFGLQPGEDSVLMLFD